ncbi:hypothetical protein T265_00857 [Opisthorchis viverrini]|uniref:DH domain-containing protein n=1 Tax=Opisthorchis viverrini TaxID=6198 RepID=A0A075ABI2_OPIVI|nr:hypothetical protein T265_00857 [Opisthorchis viverrini]KER33155.1 hypothetical protein T265_00857 [Opisthorchis viverrini]
MKSTKSCKPLVTKREKKLNPAECIVPREFRSVFGENAFGSEQINRRKSTEYPLNGGALMIDSRTDVKKQSLVGSGPMGVDSAALRESRLPSRSLTGSDCSASDGSSLSTSQVSTYSPSSCSSSLECSPSGSSNCASHRSKHASDDTTRKSNSSALTDDPLVRSSVAVRISETCIPVGLTAQFHPSRMRAKLKRSKVSSDHSRQIGETDMASDAKYNLSSHSGVSPGFSRPNSPEKVGGLKPEIQQPIVLEESNEFSDGLNVTSSASSIRWNVASPEENFHSVSRLDSSMNRPEAVQIRCSKESLPVLDKQQPSRDVSSNHECITQAPPGILCRPSVNGSETTGRDSNSRATSWKITANHPTATISSATPNSNLDFGSSGPSPSSDHSQTVQPPHHEEIMRITETIGRILEELVTTERSYCRSLYVFSEVVAKGVCTKSSVSLKELRLLFPRCLPDLYVMHIKMLDQMEEGLTEFFQHGITTYSVQAKDVALPFVVLLNGLQESTEHFLSGDLGYDQRAQQRHQKVHNIQSEPDSTEPLFPSLYRRYLSEFTTAMKIQRKLLRQSSKFRQTVKRLREHPDCEGFDFSAFLLAPVQRLPRYLLLIRQLTRQFNKLLQCQLLILNIPIRTAWELTKQTEDRLHQILVNLDSQLVGKLQRPTGASTFGKPETHGLNSEDKQPLSVPETSAERVAEEAEGVRSRVRRVFSDKVSNRLDEQIQPDAGDETEVTRDPEAFDLSKATGNHSFIAKKSNTSNDGDNRDTFLVGHELENWIKTSELINASEKDKRRGVLFDQDVCSVHEDQAKNNARPTDSSPEIAIITNFQPNTVASKERDFNCIERYGFPVESSPVGLEVQLVGSHQPEEENNARTAPNRPTDTDAGGQMELIPSCIVQTVDYTQPEQEEANFHERTSALVGNECEMRQKKDSEWHSSTVASDITDPPLVERNVHHPVEQLHQTVRDDQLRTEPTAGLPNDDSLNARGFTCGDQPEGKSAPHKTTQSNLGPKQQKTQVQQRKESSTLKITRAQTFDTRPSVEKPQTMWKFSVWNFFRRKPSSMDDVSGATNRKKGNDESLNVSTDDLERLKPLSLTEVGDVHFYEESRSTETKQNVQGGCHTPSLNASWSIQNQFGRTLIDFQEALQVSLNYPQNNDHMFLDETGNICFEI